MTPVEELVAAPVAAPPFDIVRAAYVELRVTDLERSSAFYQRLFGRRPVRQDKDPSPCLSRNRSGRRHTAVNGGLFTELRTLKRKHLALTGRATRLTGKGNNVWGVAFEACKSVL